MKAEYMMVCAKVRTDDDIHDEVMSNIGVKQRCPLSPALFGRYWQGFSIFIKHCVCQNLFIANKMILLSKSSKFLQRPFKKLYEFFISSRLDVNLSYTKIMVLGKNKGQLNQNPLYLGGA